MASRLTESTDFAMQSIADSWRGVKSDSWAATTIPVDPSTTDFDGVNYSAMFERPRPALGGMGQAGESSRPGVPPREAAGSTESG